jgi:Zn-dependent protease
VTRCPQCGTEIAPALLACPACHRLVHADELQRLAADADRSTEAGDFTTALGAWRRALDLLPPDSRQFATVTAKLAELSRRADAAGVPAAALPEKPTWVRRAGIPGAILLFLWKFKVVLVFILTKGKLLLLGLTKGSTFFSMLLFLGAYWTLWGWQFAAGFVVSIYIHEMGHVAMLQRFGIPATPPMFIPGVGAMIRARFYPHEPAAEARVGLAGPIWGMGAAIACYVIYRATAVPLWVALARTGAWLNLFNLLPVWQLDGAHAFKALTRQQRWIITAVLGGMYFLTAEGMLVLLALVAAWRAFGTEAPVEGDSRTLWEFLYLVVILGALLKVPVPTGTAGP